MPIYLFVLGLTKSLQLVKIETKILFALFICATKDDNLIDNLNFNLNYIIIDLRSIYMLF